jgi:AcrR family transcriptional regulator
VVKSRAVKGAKSSPSALSTLAADAPVVKSGAGRVGRSGLADKPPAERGRGGPAWSNVVVSRDEQFRLKRNALLREAARAFSGRGYHNTSLDDVAAVLGVTKAALYHYVRSKQEILFECHMMSLDLGDEALEYARRHGRTGLEQTTLLARRYIELITGEMGRFAVLSEYDALDSDSRAVVGRRRDQFELALREMVARGGTDGSIRGVDPKLAVFYFMGAVNWMTRWFRPDGELSGVDIAAGFSDLLVESLRSRG